MRRELCIMEDSGDDIMRRFAGQLVPLDDVLLDKIGTCDESASLDENSSWYKNQRAEIDLVWAILKKLYPQNHRRYLVMYLRFYLNISFRDIAHAFKCSHVMIIKEVKSTIKKIQKYLETHPELMEENNNESNN